MLVEREEIAVPWSPGDLQILTLEFIREFWDDVSHTPNERELEVIAYNMHPMYEDSDDNERSAEQILDTCKIYSTMLCLDETKQYCSQVAVSKINPN